MSHLGFLAPITAAGMLFASAGAATAAPPEHFGPFEGSGSFTADCGPFLAYVSGYGSTRFTRFTDANGDVTRIQQFVYAPADTWTNLTTGKTIAVRAHFVQTLDARTGSLTIVGFRYLVSEVGDGVTVQEVGRIVYADETEQDLLSMAGQHHIYSFDLIGPVLCGALM